jgi:hypothetical protein
VDESLPEPFSSDAAAAGRIFDLDARFGQPASALASPSSSSSSTTASAAAPADLFYRPGSGDVIMRWSNEVQTVLSSAGGKGDKKKQKGKKFAKVQDVRGFQGALNGVIKELAQEKGMWGLSKATLEFEEE